MSLQQVSADLAGRFKKFFQNPGHFKHPRFKAKHRSSMSYTSKNVNHSIHLENGYLRLPKLGFVRFCCGREVNGIIKRATIQLTSSGTFRCSLLVDDESQVAYKKTGRSVGIDMGIADLMTLSTGEKIRTIRFDQLLKTQRHYWEKHLARRWHQAQKKGIPLAKAENYQKLGSKLRRSMPKNEISGRIVTIN